jgi:hypothetical protein
MSIKAQILRNITASAGPTWAMCGYGVEGARSGDNSLDIGYDIIYANVSVSYNGGIAVMAFPLYGEAITPPSPTIITRFHPQYLKPLWSA